MKRIKDLLRKLLFDGEETSVPLSEQKQEQEQEQEQETVYKVKKHRRRKYQKAPIVYGGTDVSKGVIKKRKTGYVLYLYQDGKVRQLCGEFDELQKKLDKFQEEPTLAHWEQLFGRKFTNPETNISKREDGIYRVVKYTQGRYYHFGMYSSIQKARIVRDYLEFKDWDLQYLPRKFSKKKRLQVDEHYLNLLPLIYGDKEYEKFKQQ